MVQLVQARQKFCLIIEEIQNKQRGCSIKNKFFSRGVQQNNPVDRYLKRKSVVPECNLFKLKSLYFSLDNFHGPQKHILTRHKPIIASSRQEIRKFFLKKLHSTYF